MNLVIHEFLLPTVPRDIEKLTTGQTHCPGEYVTFQCTVDGDTVIWHTPEGEFSEICDSCNGTSNDYFWSVSPRAENSSILVSTLSFIINTTTNIGCRNEKETDSEPVSEQVQAEGIVIELLCM